MEAIGYIGHSLKENVLMHKIRFNGKEFNNTKEALNEVVFEHYPIVLKKNFVSHILKRRILY